MNVRELRAKRAEIVAKMRALVDAAETENRDLNEAENTSYTAYEAEVKSLDERIKRQETLPESLQGAPAVLKIKRGDDETRAIAHFVKTGDTSGVRSMVEDDEESGKPEVRVRVPTGLEKRATDEIMNVAADADGKSAVPTGFVNRIAARRSEIRLAERLGVQMIPGVGTTVNHAYENADPAVFAATSEQVDALSNTYERDRPTLATKAFTLAKKTKKVELTEELLDDEDANLLAFLADHIGRAVGLTHNSMLITEAGSTGTSVSLAATAAVTAGDPELLVYNGTLAYYEEDGGSVAWVTRPATFGAIKVLTGTSRLYSDQAIGSQGRVLCEYPVYYSNYPAAIGSGAKSLYFGNWYYMGMREDPALRLIRDPYTTDGVVILKYSFRAVYGQLIAGAIGYGKHTTT